MIPISERLNDWYDLYADDRAEIAQHLDTLRKQLDVVNAHIAKQSRELAHRERAMSSLVGIPARRNALAVERLLDELCDLNIERLNLLEEL